MGGLIGLEGNVTSKDVTRSFKMAVIRTFLNLDMGEIMDEQESEHITPPCLTLVNRIQTRSNVSFWLQFSLLRKYHNKPSLLRGNMYRNMTRNQPLRSQDTSLSVTAEVQLYTL